MLYLLSQWKHFGFVLLSLFIGYTFIISRQHKISHCQADNLWVR